MQHNYNKQGQFLSSDSRYATFYLCWFGIRQESHARCIQGRISDCGRSFDAILRCFYPSSISIQVWGDHQRLRQGYYRSQGLKWPDHCQLSLVQLGSDFSASCLPRSVSHTRLGATKTLATNNPKYATGIRIVALLVMKVRKEAIPLSQSHSLLISI